MDYDVLILGGGIIGCAAAYELSKYSLNIALIEKDYDIADDVAMINSAVIYDGCECEDALTSELEFQGNKMFPEISNKFNIPFKKTGFLMIASDKFQKKKIDKMYEQAIKRGTKDIYILNNKGVYDIEPNLNIKAEGALYSKNTGIIHPYDLALAFGEIAFDNGVNFKLEEEVMDIQKLSKGFKVITNKNKFTCNVVLNTTPQKSHGINLSKSCFNNSSKLRYFVLEKNFKNRYKNIVSTLVSDNEKIYNAPTVQGTTIAALNTNKNINYIETLKKVSELAGDIKEDEISAFYQSPYYNDNIIIDDSLIKKGYISVKGKHYAQITATPYIAKVVCKKIIDNTNTGCALKKDFADKRRDFFRFRDLSNAERKQLIKINKKYGRIICPCQLVTEGEIVDLIRRPLGARTVEGIKRRTGAISGNCQGSECLNKIVSILARETNKKYTEIVKDSKNSNIIKCRIKEFDDM